MNEGTSTASPEPTEDEGFTTTDLNDMYKRLAMLEDMVLGNIARGQYLARLRETSSSAPRDHDILDAA